MANNPQQNQLPCNEPPSITNQAQPMAMHPPETQHQVIQPVPMRPADNQPQHNRLSELVHASNSVYLRYMMVTLFERENARDFALVGNLHTLASELSLRVQERAEYIGELGRLTGSVIAYESAQAWIELLLLPFVARIMIVTIELCVVTFRLLMPANGVASNRKCVECDNEYDSKVIIISKLKYFSLVKEKLNKHRRNMFKTTCFGKWLDLNFFDHEPHMIDYILKKQGHVDAHHYDMPFIYHVDGRSLHFGRQEFSIITGFRFGTASIRLHHYGEVKLRLGVFPHKAGVKLSNLDLLSVVEDEAMFCKLSDDDAVRICLVLLLEVVFMGRLLTDHVEDTLLRLVENLDEWNAYPWGEHIWRHLYNQLLNVVHKQKWTHLHGLNSVSNYIPSYTLSGFVWVFKIWILESFESSIEWWNKSPNVTPRGIAWTRRQIFKRSDFSALFGKTSKVNYDIRPTIEEQQSDWYVLYREFAMEYVPRAPPNRVSHPYDVYLKNCTERRKRGCIRYSDLPSIDRSETSITKELMLKDHVITQMNARVFKLEAIIQVLGHDKFGGVLEKLEFNDVFRNLSAELCDELNNDFLELFASTKDAETDDDVVQAIYLSSLITITISCNT
ncbi:phospholipase-like protein [Artemisia annua]|uniref:Phospholipase-like protein n=1 Tax=Artemisia annua TaxID=35608 RepID=A0A2U1KNA4_ARTAN|nr:phospholipase-like protein [Artemisia annua]